MGITSPERVWWKPADKQEKIWITLAIIWCLILFLMMPLWHIIGKQNPSIEPLKISPMNFGRLANEFIEKYTVGEEQGFPVVAPPEGSDIYLTARMWSWSPILELETGKTYKLHLSSMDLMHGFSLMPLVTNFQVLPGHDNILTITPTMPGVYYIVCNEFCGIGHHTMVGKLIVK